MIGARRPCPPPAEQALLRLGVPSREVPSQPITEPVMLLRLATWLDHLLCEMSERVCE